MKKQTSRLTALLAVLVLVLATVCALALTAGASDSVVAWNDADKDGVIDEGEATYAKLSAALDAGEAGEATYLRLNADVSLNSSLWVYSGVFTLDMNGHNVTSTGSFLNVHNEGTELTLTDTAETKGSFRSLPST